MWDETSLTAILVLLKSTSLLCSSITFLFVWSQWNGEHRAVPSSGPLTKKDSFDTCKWPCIALHLYMIQHSCACAWVRVSVCVFSCAVTYVPVEQPWHHFSVTVHLYVSQSLSFAWNLQVGEAGHPVSPRNPCGPGDWAQTVGLHGGKLYTRIYHHSPHFSDLRHQNDRE